ncbi:MAG TPA: hypothetical protein VGE04_18060 [Chloroflexia bacterium]|jgi:hypothetical protein
MDEADLTPPTLACSSILLRLASRDDHISKKTHKFTVAAFLLRKGNANRPRETTLSLIIKDACTLYEAFTTILTNKVYGMGTLHRGKILDLNLVEEVSRLGITLEVEGEIKPDDLRPIYACIKNLPHPDTDPDAANFIASLLVDQIRRIPEADILATREVA